MAYDFFLLANVLEELVGWIAITRNEIVKRWRLVWSTGTCFGSCFHPVMVHSVLWNVAPNSVRAGIFAKMRKMDYELTVDSKSRTGTAYVVLQGTLRVDIYSGIKHEGHTRRLALLTLLYMVTGKYRAEHRRTLSGEEYHPYARELRPEKLLSRWISRVLVDRHGVKARALNGILSRSMCWIWNVMFCFSLIPRNRK